jgi:hypothetical protein
LLVVTITVALAAVAVLAAIVVVAMGGGGQLSVEHPDHPPLALPGRRAIGGTDAALLRLPLGLWGYHKQITDEALQRFAHELTERDTRIAVLEQELAEARQGGGDTRNRRLAPHPARDAMPIMEEKPMDTRTDVRSDPPPSAPREDPPAPRTDGDGEPGVDHAHTSPADLWKTIVDGPGDDAEGKAADQQEDEPVDEQEDEPAERKDEGA